MNHVLLIGEPTPLFVSLRDKLLERANTVHELAYSLPDEAAATEADGIDDATNLSRLRGWDGLKTPVNRIVLGQRKVASDIPIKLEEIEALARRHENALLEYLLLLQAAGKLLARQGGGQIWVLNQEQSFRHLSPLETSPVDTFARRAAAKSFAREIGRMNVRVNCLSIQPLAEEREPAEWRDLAPGTKIYASRFKPCRSNAVADTICSFLDQEDLPMFGLDIPIGVGLTEQNI